MKYRTPLAVDLDGTLVLSDTLHESIIKLVKSQPLSVLLLPLWLARGKAYLKQQIGARVEPDPALLPYNAPLIKWLKQERDNGRSLSLCTASNEGIANTIAEHIGLFDSVIASNGKDNIKGVAKRAALEERFGIQGFSYAGNAPADLAVWQGARSAIVVSGDTGLVDKARALCEIEKTFPREMNNPRDILRLLRTHQWAKNTLLFVPALAAHLIDLATAITLAIAFIAFSLCSSAIYVVNDLLDLESDRRHPRKRLRPFAAGSVSITAGIILVPVLLGSSALLSIQVGGPFTSVLTCYLVLTLTYSTVLKRLVLLDCLALAGLYTVRMIAGAAAISISVSFWLLAFSVFLFLSLAFVKRFVELRETTEAVGNRDLHGREYHHGDSSFIQTLGISTGMISVLVLALYIDSTASEQLYRTPEFVWGALAVFLYWICWLWLKAHRGEMHDDPVVFAVTDRVSLVCGALFLVTVFLGTLSLTP